MLGRREDPRQGSRGVDYWVGMARAHLAWRRVVTTRPGRTCPRATLAFAWWVCEQRSRGGRADSVRGPQRAATAMTDAHLPAAETRAGSLRRMASQLTTRWSHRIPSTLERPATYFYCIQYPVWVASRAAMCPPAPRPRGAHGSDGHIFSAWANLNYFPICTRQRK